MRVLLVHGLGRTPLSMLWLAHRLRRAGHAPETFGYAAWAESYRAIRERLITRIERADAGAAPWVAIGHSLGGLLLRDAIATTEPAPPDHLAHLIMLATPNQPPRLAPRAARVPPFRWFTGECGRRLASPEYFRTLPAPSVPCTVLAGTHGFSGRWSPFGEEPNDGIVAVSETVVSTAAPPRTFPVAHTFIMNDTAVQAAIIDILAGCAPAGGE
ncbi:MAG: alpha/beta fold hydrolase [Gemmatimonadales bacterium]|nr:alpha/beta fold hydrolase [Gemmatimonadales bacterium]MDZ4390242.1 alpha/beta fold hydrolase [Gemmatimonadales bacterium]